MLSYQAAPILRTYSSPACTNLAPYATGPWPPPGMQYNTVQASTIPAIHLYFPFLPAADYITGI